MVSSGTPTTAVRVWQARLRVRRSRTTSPAPAPPPALSGPRPSSTSTRRSSPGRVCSRSAARSAGRVSSAGGPRCAAGTPSCCCCCPVPTRTRWTCCAAGSPRCAPAGRSPRSEPSSPRPCCEIVEPLVYSEATELIAEHRAHGDEVVVLSASGLEVVEPIAALVGADRCRATRMGVADGRYKGVIEYYCYGEAKAQAARRHRRRARLPARDCRAYSDSITDLPLLEAVGHPTVVNPDRALRRLAAATRLAGADASSIRSRCAPLRATAAAAAAAGVGGPRRWPAAGLVRLGRVTVRGDRPPLVADLRAVDRHPPCLNRCTGSGLAVLRVTDYKEAHGPRSARGGAAEKHPSTPIGLRARRSGAPRTARRGRHVVVGLRTGTPDAEATTRHVVHAWISMFARSRAASPRGDAARLYVPRVGDRYALLRPGLHARTECRQPRREPVGGDPQAKPSAARRYCGGMRRCPTSGTARPFGSRPAGHRGEPGGGPGHHPVRRPRTGPRRAAPRAPRRPAPAPAPRSPPVTRSASSPSRCDTARSGRGRPSSAAVPPDRHEAGRGQHVQPGQRLQRGCAAPGGQQPP